MFFLSKKHNWRSWILIYIMTLGYLFSIFKFFKKVIYKGWLGVSTICSLFSDNKLGIVQTADHRSSWIKMILKSFLFSSITSVRSLFFWIFCKKIFRFLIIIGLPHSQLSKLICLYLYKALDTFLHAIPC